MGALWLPASAQQQAYPIEIVQCGVLTAPARIQVDFVNRSKRTITAITFGVVREGHIVASATDVDQILPNGHHTRVVRIANNGVALKSGSALCVPTAVQFTNYVWHPTQ
jgi:hypothetical protein